MTNELGTTLSDIEAKAERKLEALECLGCIDIVIKISHGESAKYELETIRKYIEEN